MIKNSKQLMKFSLISFLFVFIFGLIRSSGPFKTFFADPDAMSNVMLFHSHFDQLCWLGAAAIGAAFYVFKDSYDGGEKSVRIFTKLYIIGTLIFSLAFLIRAVGFASGTVILQKILFILFVSTGGLIFLILIGFAVYILKNTKRKNTK